STSPGCSTTQITRLSRLGSVHSRQGSCSVKLPHRLQKPTRSRIARIASARRSTSSRGARSIWSASRCARVVPRLGRFSRPSVKSSRYFEVYMGGDGSEGQGEAAGDRADRLVHLGLGLLLGLADRREDQVFEQRRVPFLERLGADLQLLEHLLAVDDGAHHAAASGGLEALVLELL